MSTRAKNRDIAEAQAEAIATTQAVVDASAGKIDASGVDHATAAQELADASGLLAVQRLFYLPYLNYRDSDKIRSHKPSVVVTKTGVDNAENNAARTYRNMRELALAGKQPWSTSHFINVAPLALVEKYMRITKAHLQAEIDSWDAKDARRALYPQGIESVTHIGISGHCRQHTLADVVAETGFTDTCVIPVYVNEITSAMDFYSIQARDNEETGVGLRKTETSEQLRQLFRMVDAGAIIGKETDISRLLGVKRGVEQTLYANYIVSQILKSTDETDGRARMLKGTPSDKKEAAIYSPVGYIPVSKITSAWTGTGKRGGEVGILAPYLAALDTYRATAGSAPEVREKALAELEQTRQLAIPVVEGEIAKLVRGTSNAVKVSGKDEWQTVVSNAPAGSILNQLGTAVLNGKLLSYVEANAKLLHCTSDELSACIPAGA